MHCIDTLNMTKLAQGQSSTVKVWESEPYAEVKGKCGTVEGDFFQVHTLGEGNCFYLAFSITINKAWEDRV